ncbi:MAG: hypothetical protein ACREML_06635, partial [Vulcanimicrobiaceae bacterium]
MYVVARLEDAAAFHMLPDKVEHLIEAVIFDMDGVLLDSEQIWDKAREQYVKDVGGRWSPSAQREMMGMSSTE